LLICGFGPGVLGNGLGGGVKSAVNILIAGATSVLSKVGLGGKRGGEALVSSVLPELLSKAALKSCIHEIFSGDWNRYFLPSEAIESSKQSA
jgi:hypothetical protein